LDASEHQGERAKHVFLSLLQARVGSSLVSRLGNLAPEAIFETPFSDLAGWNGIPDKAALAFNELRRGFDAPAVEHRLSARGIEVLTLADDGYPRMLRNIPDPPPALYVDGAVPETVSVALVGSRKASTTGVETARALGLALAERGVCVISGLALGVDAAAHEGAVEAGGATVGVLGCGIDVTYPPRYKRIRVAFPRSPLGGADVPIRNIEGLMRAQCLTVTPEAAKATTSCRRWRL
jgi:DNA processing protein